MQSKLQPTFTVSARATRQYSVSHIVALSILDAVSHIVAEHVHPTARVLFRVRPPDMAVPSDKMPRYKVLSMRISDVMEQMPGLLHAYDHFMSLPYSCEGTAVTLAVSWWVDNAEAIQRTAREERSRGCTLGALQSEVWAQCAPEADIPYTLSLASQHDQSYDVRAVQQIGMPQYFRSGDVNSRLVRAMTLIHQWPNAPFKGVTNVYVFEDVFDAQFPGLTYARKVLTDERTDSSEAAKKAIAWWLRNAPAIEHMVCTGTALGLEGVDLQRHIWEATLTRDLPGCDDLTLPVFDSDTAAGARM
jgi:hypothetical protein